MKRAGRTEWAAERELDRGGSGAGLFLGVLVEPVPRERVEVFVRCGRHEGPLLELPSGATAGQEECTLAERELRIVEVFLDIGGDLTRHEFDEFGRVVLEVVEIEQITEDHELALLSGKGVEGTNLRFRGYIVIDY